MLTFLLAALVLVIAVAGAELVRSTCRRQLMSTLVSPSQPADARAALD